jgi:hypothetical protein
MEGLELDSDGIALIAKQKMEGLELDSDGIAWRAKKKKSQGWNNLEQRMEQSIKMFSVWGEGGSSN